MLPWQQSVTAYVCVCLSAVMSIPRHGRTGLAEPGPCFPGDCGDRGSAGTGDISQTKMLMPVRTDKEKR